MSGSAQAFNKPGSTGEEKEGRSWRRMLGERGFLKMEDVGCVYMLKEIVEYTSGRSSD